MTAADGTRSAVRVEDVVARLRASGQGRAARIVASLPASDGLLDLAACDRLLIRIHAELQRLSEELQQGRRVAELLDPWIRDLREHSDDRVRIVDAGCGTGFLLRWLAAHDPWAGAVEFVGVDLDGTLVDRANELAAHEGISARFVRGDALSPEVAVADPRRTLMISTGLLHHLDRRGLDRLFARQAELAVAGFAHWDPRPGPLAVLGAWIFHRSRMREPVSRHDGVLSVRRAHPAAVLAEAASHCDYDVICSDRHALTEVLRPVSGRRR